MSAAPEYSNYYDALRRIHQAVNPTTYLEIGVWHGDSLRVANKETLCLGIDPAPELDEPAPDNTIIYSMTSDEFFQAFRREEVLGNGDLDLAFIDGLHLFESVLRDFINVERWASPHTTIVIHDVLPIDAETSTRIRTTDRWTGDVWKISPCLAKYRPELRLSLIDAAPSGLLLVHGLNADNRVLQRLEGQIVREFVPQTFADFESQREWYTGLVTPLATAVAPDVQEGRRE